MKRLSFLLLALIALLPGCSVFGTKDEYRVTPKIFRLEDLLEDLDRAKNPEVAKESVKTAAPISWAGKYLLKVNTLSGGDNYTGNNCDESALVDVDKDRKIIDVKQFPSSAKTCGNEESLKATFWGKTLPAALLAAGQVGGNAVLGTSFPKPVGDRINVTGVDGGIRNENEQEQKAEGGSGGKSVVEKGAVVNNNSLTANPTAYGGQGGQGGKGGSANAKGGNATGGSIQPGAVQVTAQGGQGGSTGPVNVKAEGGNAEAEIKDSGNSKIIGSGNSANSNTAQGGAGGQGGLSYSSSWSEGGKVIGSGNSSNSNYNSSSSGSYSNSYSNSDSFSNSSAANYNSNVGGPIDVDVKVQPGESGGRHGRHGKGWD